LTSPARPLTSLGIVVPLHDEQENVRPLVDELLETIRGLSIPAIAWLVDDGSTDLTWKRIEERLDAEPLLLCALRHPCRRGQSAALLSGALASRSSHLATLDGDLQNDPRDLLRMLPHLAEADVVLGRRRERFDPRNRAWVSRLANRVRRAVLRDPGTDSGCSLRVFPRDAFLRLPAFDGMHRFLPALFHSAGLSICEVEVSHRPRRSGRTKYSNLGRLARTVPDLLGVLWMSRRAIRTDGVTCVEPRREQRERPLSQAERD
jgi:glycosyltransferase involved in cell wall biosynthesis